MADSKMATRPSPFLDKLCSSPHMPSRPGSHGFCSTRVLPDLTHTAIASRFCPPLIHMTKVFRHEAFLESLQFERPRAEARNKCAWFYNHVLCELEAEHREKAERRERIWTQGKRRFGFPEDSFLGSRTGSKEGGFEVDTFEEDDGPVVEPAMSVLKEEEDYDDEDEYGASALRYKSGMQTSPPSPTSSSRARESPISRPAPLSLQRSKSASLLLESLSQHLERASTAQSSPISKRRPKPASVTTQRPRKAFNRMTFFECLLDTMHVPEPKVPRYGQLPSPIKVTRVATAASHGSRMFRLGMTPPPPSRATTTRDYMPSSSSGARASTSEAGSRLPNLSSGSERGTSFNSSFSFDLPLEEPILPMEEEEKGELMVENAGLARWTVDSVQRCLNGEKPRKPKLGGGKKW